MKHLQKIRQACYSLGYEEPISIEMDGTVWLGIDPDREYPDMEPIMAEVERLEEEQEQRKNEVLSRLGLTLEEVKLLLQ